MGAVPASNGTVGVKGLDRLVGQKTMELVLLRFDP